MAQQNQKTIKKDREVKAKRSRKINTKSSTAVDKKKITKKIKIPDGHITAFGQKVKIINDISTIDGTLHSGEVVKVEASGFAGKDLRVIDSMGRMWSVNLSDISLELN